MDSPCSVYGPAHQMPAHVRELLMLLGYGFIPSIETMAALRWEHPALSDIETTASAMQLIRGLRAL